MQFSVDNSNRWFSACALFMQWIDSVRILLVSPLWNLSGLIRCGWIALATICSVKCRLIHVGWKTQIWIEIIRHPQFLSLNLSWLSHFLWWEIDRWYEVSKSESLCSIALVFACTCPISDSFFIVLILRTFSSTCSSNNLRQLLIRSDVLVQWVTHFHVIIKVRFLCWGEIIDGWQSLSRITSMPVTYWSDISVSLSVDFAIHQHLICQLLGTDFLCFSRNTVLDERGQVWSWQ